MMSSPKASRRASRQIVNLLYRPVDVSPERGSESAYVRVVDQFADGSLTFCLVDGMYRDHRALNVLDKHAPGRPAGGRQRQLVHAI